MVTHMSANILVPEVGESIVDARVAKWLKKEGDAVAAGDPLVELETDKIDLEVAAPQAGVLSRIDHKRRSRCEGRRSARRNRRIAERDAATAATAPVPAKAADAAKAQPSRGPSERRATPAARNAAQQNEVDLRAGPRSGDAGARDAP